MGAALSNVANLHGQRTVPDEGAPPGFNATCDEQFNQALLGSSQSSPVNVFVI